MDASSETEECSSDADEVQVTRASSEPEERPSDEVQVMDANSEPEESECDVMGENDKETPISARVQLHWTQVRYIDAEKKRLNAKVAPTEPPYSGMVFKGYDFSKDRSKVYAFWAKEGVSLPGCRRKRGPSGGINKAFHKELSRMKRELPHMVPQWKRSVEHTYVRRGNRFGIKDPEI